MNNNTFKTIKKLENGFLIQELVLTKEWANLVADMEKAWLSQEWISSILTPYDTVKKQACIDKKYVAFSAQYFKKEL